jgi:hypothetical protein
MNKDYEIRVNGITLCVYGNTELCIKFKDEIVVAAPVSSVCALLAPMPQDLLHPQAKTDQQK